MPKTLSCFYVVAQAALPNGGIYHYSIDSDARCTFLDFCPLHNCNWIEFSQDGKRAYATGIENGIGRIRTLSVEPDGTLHLCKTTVLNDVTCQPCHIAVYQEGHRVYTANYDDGSLSELMLDPNGEISLQIRTIRHQGHSVHPTRQTSPHVHQVNITPDRRFLAVVDLGIDEIISYPLTTEKGIDSENALHNPILPPGCGPRHLVFSPNGQFAYLVTELGNELVYLCYRDGCFSILEQSSTLPELCSMSNTAAAIRLSPDHQSIFATNRGHDSIVRCQLFPYRKLGAKAFFSSLGKGPRDGNFVANGEFFLAANEKNDTVTIFRYIASEDRLEFTGQQLSLPAPMQITPQPK